MVHRSMAELGQNSFVSGPKRLHYAFLLECLSFRCSRKVCFSSCLRWCMHAQLCLNATPRTAAHQAPLSMGFSRQEYLSRLPFPSPGDPPNLRIKPESPVLQVRATSALRHLGAPCV